MISLPPLSPHSYRYIPLVIGGCGLTLLTTPQDYLDGELNPYFSSEPVPKPVKGALIRKVVGSNYLSEVGNKKK